MRPLLFRWRNIEVWSYPAMLYVGLVAGIVIGNAVVHRAAIDPLRVYVATLILIVPALAGARLQYVFTHWNRYRSNPRMIWNRRDSGFSMYGGLPAALVVSIPLLRLLRLNSAAFWDVAAFTILTGMIFTRIGCFLHGCCVGRASDSWFTFYLPNQQGIWRRRVPSQLLEAAWAALLLLAAVVLRSRVTTPGMLFLLMAAAYACGRLGMEFTRERNPHSTTFNWAHGFSLITLLSSVLLLANLWRN